MKNALRTGHEWGRLKNGVDKKGRERRKTGIMGWGWGKRGRGNTLQPWGMRGENRKEGVTVTKKRV